MDHKNNYKILYVEDDSAERAAFKNCLEKEGFEHEYEIAGSFSEATSLLKSNNYDAVVTDFKVGDGNAFHILNLDLKCPVVILAGVDDIEAVKKSNKCGMCSLLLKNGKNEELRLLPIEIEKAIDHYRTKQELISAREAAEKATRAKTEFISNMSHELRTPLNAIIGFSDMIRMGLSGEISEKQMDFVEDIYSSGEHLLSLINDILDLSKIETGNMELNIASVNLKELIQRSMLFFKEKVLKNNLKLTMEIDKDVKNYELQVDEKLVKQVLINLISNAVKFTPQGGEIVVGARKAGKDPDMVEIYVKDTGIGIKGEDHKLVFQPFKQIESVFTKQYAGTGLGLALSKDIVNVHGGEIWFESEWQKGSLFSFTLPLAKGLLQT